MYSEGVTWEEYLLTHDENDIEAGLLKSLADDKQDDLFRREVEEDKTVLRKIDQLKISGQYESCRAAALKAVMAADEREMKKFYQNNPGMRGRLDAVDEMLRKPNGETDRQCRNLFDGLKSPDRAQAERFKAMYESLGLATKTYADVEKLLPALERAKVTRRKPSLPTPWTNEIVAMDGMRRLLAVTDGLSIAEAARQVADQERRAGSPNRGKRLERLYSQKMALRN